MNSIKPVGAQTVASTKTSTDPASLTRDLASFSQSSIREFRGPESLTQAQRAAGLHMNRIALTLTGNSHFPGWWDEVPHDTHFVIVQSSAFKGQSVSAAGETFMDAAVVYAKKEAGIRQETFLDIPAKAGEKARILYYRGGSDASVRFSQMGRTELRSNYGAAIGGDPHFRDVLLTITAAPTADSAPTKAKLVHHKEDHYGWGKVGDQSLELGAGANEEDAAAKKVTPMMAPGK